jgi:hypothetical protein
MEALFRFLAGYEIFIYLILGIGFVFSLRWLWQAYKELQDAVYGLERQIAMRHFTTAIGSVLLIFMLAVGELFITSFIIPDLPAATFLQTPTVDLVQGTPLPPGLSTPVVDTTGATNGTPSASSDCIPGKLDISSPTAGNEVKGRVDIFGTVNVDDLGFYKIEFAESNLENWATFYAGRNTEPEKPIGAWDTTQLTPGEYQIRLVATDNQGVEFPACTITVRVIGSQ